jgi:predicted phage-related endonuclease
MQCFVCNFEIVHVFVMIELHKYKLFKVVRNDALIKQIVSRLVELWERIQERNPPPAVYERPETSDLLTALYGRQDGKTIVMPEEAVEWWGEYQRLGECAKEIDVERLAFKNRVLEAVGDAAVIRLPGGMKEVTRSVSDTTFITETDVEELRLKVGQPKRKGFVVLRERKTKEK